MSVSEQTYLQLALEEPNDVDSKLPEYQRRGDREIWRLHPFDRNLIAWRRQPDGSYSESHYTGGSVQPVALPGVTIDLDALFD